MENILRVMNATARMAYWDDRATPLDGTLDFVGHLAS